MTNGPVQVPNKLAKQTSRVKNGPVQRNLHNLLLTKAMKALEDLVESLSSLVSNASSLISFGRRKSRVMLELVKTAQKVNSLSCQNVSTTCRAKLYQSTTFRGPWHTLLESSWSPVSHSRNGLSFGIPNKTLWSVYWKLL